MAHKWLTLNKNFYRSLCISKIRYDTSINCPLSTGTFVKASSMASWTKGVDGIPTGWTVENNS